mmetsp:Transcript_4841/g.6760  ORF Transcript_4841/g.6760 Transcript_4841/m.6760 type:complete len:229 (-) Transcript_4841:439-1125(-)
MRPSTILFCVCLVLHFFGVWADVNGTCWFYEEDETNLFNTTCEATFPIIKECELERALYGIGEVIEVTDDELKLVIESARRDDFWLVKFYAYWCPFSQDLAPQYALLAKTYPTLPVLSIDASQYPDLNYRYGIYGFPKVILFHGNDTQTYRKYGGNRTYNSLRDWINRHTKMQPINITIADDYYTDYKAQYIEPEARDIYLELSCAFLAVVATYQLFQSRHRILGYFV